VIPNEEPDCYEFNAPVSKILAILANADKRVTRSASREAIQTVPEAIVTATTAPAVDISGARGGSKPTTDAIPSLVQRTPMPATIQPQYHILREHYDTIATVHNSTCGHHGVNRTMEILKQNPTLLWRGMLADVKHFIRQCPACQFMNDTNLKANIAPYNVSTFYPMDRVNLDHVGPLPEDADGYCYILPIVDVFSRFVELYPTKGTTALETAKCVVNHMGRYGHPDEIFTDNGPAFISDLMRYLVEFADIKHTTILPYSHQENSIVERANKEVIRHLRAIVFDKNVVNKWSIYLPLVQRIMNTTPKISTGIAPARVIYGNNIDLDRGIFQKGGVYIAKTAKLTASEEYIADMTTGQAKIIAIAQETQRIINAEHVDKKRAKNAHQVSTFAVDDMVLVAYHKSTLLGTRQRPDKLSTNYKGPYRVVNVQGTRYNLLDLISGKVRTEHVSSLKTFNYDRNIVNAKDVARNASREFGIETILDLRGESNRRRKYLRTNLEALVKWQDYSHEHNTWEPYASIKLSIAFKTYCNSNDCTYLLPTVEYDNLEDDEV
jgi:transposase InsO family protein